MVLYTQGLGGNWVKKKTRIRKSRDIVPLTFTNVTLIWIKCCQKCSREATLLLSGQIFWLKWPEILEQSWQQCEGLDKPLEERTPEGFLALLSRVTLKSWGMSLAAGGLYSCTQHLFNQQADHIRMQNWSSDVTLFLICVVDQELFTLDKRRIQKDPTRPMYINTDPVPLSISPHQSRETVPLPRCSWWGGPLWWDHAWPPRWSTTPGPSRRLPPPDQCPPEKIRKNI